MAIQTHICVTRELAQAAGKLAGFFPNSNVTIVWDDDRPEAIWEIIINTYDYPTLPVYRFLVDDQTGEVSPDKYSLAELESMPTIGQGQYDNLKIQTDEWRVWLSRMKVADGAKCDNLVLVEQLLDGVWTANLSYEAK